MTTFYFNPYALISFASFIIMILMGILLWRKYYTSQAKFVLLLFASNAIYSLFYSFEISFKTIQEVIWFYRLEYFGIPFLATFYFMFALHFSGRSNWLTLKNRLMIFSIPLITLVLDFTNEYHHLFYTEERMNLAGPFPSFTFVPGVWYYIHQGYVILLMILSLFLLIKMLKSKALLYKRQLQLILLATTFPFLGYIAYQVHLVPFGIDPVSFTFTLTGIIIFIALTRFKLFDLVPIARFKLFEQIQEGVLVFDVNNRLVDFNLTVSKQLNFSKKDLGFTANDLNSRWPELLDFIENNNKGKLELKRFEDGKAFSYDINLIELENSKDVRSGKLVVIRDISDLINTEHERNITASKLDAVISAMPDMMLVIDSKGVFTDFFASETDHFFLNKEEVLGASLHQMFNKEEADILLGRLSDCLMTNRMNTYQYEMNFSGDLKHYEVRINKLDDNQVLVIVRDVSESVGMRHDLLYQSGFQKILMELASRFIYISSSETDAVINDALRQIGDYIGVERSYIFRYDFENGTMFNSHEWYSSGTNTVLMSQQSIPIHMISDWTELHKIGKPTLVENLKQLNPNNALREKLESIGTKSLLTIPMISQKNCLGFVGFASTKNNKKWFDSEISLLKIFTGMLANLQEKIILEQSLAEARIKADASNKLKTALINNISHEIRTPLNGIIGFGEIIANEQLSLDEKNKFLAVVQESSERLIQTIDDYLDISMLVTGNLEVHKMQFVISRMIDEVIEEFAEPCKLKQIVILSEVPVSLQSLSLHSDYDLIRKVFNHLVGNSLKFTAKGSIHIGMTQNGGQVTLYVKDTGIGIAENAQKYVFDSFMQEDFSSTRMYEGSGLGLSVVKGIVTLLGGEIHLSSTKGIGTTFSFTLPIDIK